MGKTPLLEISRIEKSFGSQKILKGISLQVFAGEFLTFLGPSGCGKTTTLRIVAGFEEPDKGTVRLNGEDVTRLPPYKRDVHTVFQHYALFPHFDVFENVAFSLRLEKTPEPEVASRVRGALDLVKLGGFEKRRIDQLSGGQQQRVAVARSLVGRPSLLLLDEPLGALDLKLRRQMQLELKAIQKKTGITFVYVTHDQEEALTLSDRIAVFNAGEIVQLGDPKSIYETPRSSFVADFIGSANILEAQVKLNDGEHVVLLVEDEVELRLPRPVGFNGAEGAKVPLAIRPERISVHFEEPASDAGRLTFPGALQDVVYLGSATQMIISPFPKSAKVLAATIMGKADVSIDGARRRVWCEVSPRDVLLWPS
ncbi:MAG: polyamine ABC transporter ATP-binding protein [Elusimicrobia bacterium]|nr:polyamine ABC transporter ATP-binding protein [Elusimicrobiota bacterium]